MKHAPYIFPEIKFDEVCNSETHFSDSLCHRLIMLFTKFQN